jgi:hypothetical protein
LVFCFACAYRKTLRTFARVLPPTAIKKPPP